MAGVFADWLRRLPDGAILRSVFHAMVALTITVLGLDLRSLMSAEAAGAFDMPSSSPVTMERPRRDNQIRPYLPHARPVAPDETSERLLERPHEESEAEPMRFRLGTHGAAFAEGTITPGAADSFAEFLQSERAKAVTEIVLHSPGGSVTDAAAIAHLIRDRKLNTRVLPDGYCASSCPLIFAGGVARVADATSWIGVHQVFALTTAFGTLADGMEQAQMVSADAQNLLEEFGVNPLVWTRAMSTPKEKLYLFTPTELAELKLATNIEGKAPEPETGS